MDKVQARAFVDYMVGDRSLGGTEHEYFGTPHSPELRAFIVGQIGEKTPPNGYSAVECLTNPAMAVQAKALANLLREIADILDPAAQEA
jgi:hypothetical protein